MVTVVALAFSLPFHPWPPSPQTPDPGRSCSDALVSDDEDGATQEPGGSPYQSAIKESGHPDVWVFHLSVITHRIHQTWRKVKDALIISAPDSCG
jgi:hypothetical protein